MQIKLPKEIMTYSEEIWQGFNLRELACIAGAIVSSVVTYFLTKPVLGGWPTILCTAATAAPFGLLGFFKYNGLKFEQLVWQFIKTKFLMPKKRKYVSENFHETLLNMEDAK